MMSTEVVLNFVEIKKLRKFSKEHKDCFKGENGPGRFEISSTPLGFAPAITAKCLKCGESLDISDTDSW